LQRYVGQTKINQRIYKKFYKFFELKFIKKRKTRTKLQKIRNQRQQTLLEDIDFYFLVQLAIEIQRD